MKKNKNNLKEPFVRIVKRDNVKIQNIILIYSIAIVIGLLLSGLISMMFSNKEYYLTAFANVHGTVSHVYFM